MYFAQLIPLIVYSSKIVLTVCSEQIHLAATDRCAPRKNFSGVLSMVPSLVSGIMRILFVKLWQDKETATSGEKGGQRGFNN